MRKSVTRVGKECIALFLSSIGLIFWAPRLNGAVGVSPAVRARVARLSTASI